MRVLFLTALFFSISAFSQTEDAEVWGGLGLKASPIKNLSLKYETQSRFYKNVSTLKTHYHEFSANYEFVKNLDIGTSYRYSRKNRETHFSGENRICLNLSYGQKLGKTGLRIKTRLRYQLAFDRTGVVNDVIYPRINNTFRWKVDLKYKNKEFKRVSPFVGYEYFKSIQPVGISGFADAYRVYGGLDFDLPARHELGLKYIYELENNAAPGISHIYVVQYNYSLPSKWFKKKD